MFRTGFRQKKAPSECKCTHPRICHYTKEGHCVYQKCECKAFDAKGRQSFTNIREPCRLGHSHDSGLERKICFDFETLKRSGEIRDFISHPRIDLLGPSGSKIATYVVDFVIYHTDGTTEYVEAKGEHLMNLQPWPLKWALLQDMYKGDPLVKFRVVRG